MVKFKTSLCGTSLSLILLLSCGGQLNPAVAAAPLHAACIKSESNSHRCAQQVCSATPTNLRPVQNGRIPLGRFTPEPYVVAVPGRSRSQLKEVRLCIPDALILPSRRGQYIHVASFDSRRPAEKLSRYLRRKGLDARVTYFRQRKSEGARK